MRAHEAPAANPYLSPTTGAGASEDVAAAWDRGNDGWWDWYMSLAHDDGRAGDLRLYHDSALCKLTPPRASAPPA